MGADRGKEEDAGCQVVGVETRITVVVLPEALDMGRVAVEVGVETGQGDMLSSIEKTMIPCWVLVIIVIGLCCLGIIQLLGWIF
jgi:hypothetical protein